MGYVGTVLYGIGTGRETVAQNLPILVVMLLASLVYGLVLGSVYDCLAAHRTFLGPNTD